jgi:hypothetical protein
MRGVDLHEKQHGSFDLYNIGNYNNNSNNSMQFFIIYLPSEQLQGTRPITDSTV